MHDNTQHIHLRNFPIKIIILLLFARVASCYLQLRYGLEITQKLDLCPPLYLPVITVVLHVNKPQPPIRGVLNCVGVCINVNLVTRKTTDIFVLHFRERICH